MRECEQTDHSHTLAGLSRMDHHTAFVGRGQRGGGETGAGPWAGNVGRSASWSGWGAAALVRGR